MSPRSPVHAPERPNIPERPNTVPWPPLIYLGAIVAAALLEYLFPHTPALPESLLLRWLGGAVFLGGLWLALAGIRQFVEIDTPVNPTGQARQLATEGIYARTRNPMYLGALVGFVGLGLALRSTWLLLAVPAMAVALHILAISREEAYLERVFGEEYRHFRSRVRRWI